LIQRVLRAEVRVDGAAVGAIGPGRLAFVCAERGDREREADALVGRVLGYRVFANAAGRMNRNLPAAGRAAERRGRGGRLIRYPLVDPALLDRRRPPPAGPRPRRRRPAGRLP